MSEVPTMRDEIDRKAFEHLEALALQLEHGEISEAQFDTGVRSVWACVSGLASSWVIDTISEIKDQKGGRSFKDRRFLFCRAGSQPPMIQVLQREHGGTNVLLIPLTGGSVKRWDFPDKPLDAFNWQNKVAKAMVLTKGYRQI